jgi:uncharacterized repeat protein (TIGR03803 family)
MSVTPQLAAPLSQSHAGVTAERTHVRPAYRALYSFKGFFGDGAEPDAGLLDVNGTLYGTTVSGGASCSGGGNPRCGTVFSITSSGKETELHRFGGGSKDGKLPMAGLINVNGTLYGTTSNGGADCEKAGGCGTVFSITTSGTETVLYSFNSKYGYNPQAGLVNVNGTLYGTTVSGGSSNNGTVFAIKKSGTQRVLHSFGGSGDGEEPLAGLLNVNGMLYGTTFQGGANGQGIVFSITTSGKETVLHSFGPFGSTGDGYRPEAGLISVKGALYGTTVQGGEHGVGTVFTITPSGAESVLHSFAGGKRDGDYPDAGLLNVNDTLYGTTFRGGAHCWGSSESGCGTIFSITTSGTEAVLYSFGGYPDDGALPGAGLINVKGTLYGTTEVGGASGRGMVFSLSP